MITENLERYLKELRTREFHVDCTQMELTRESDGKRYVGPGYIRQKGTRNFEAKIYSHDKYEMKDVFPGAFKQAGVLYSDADHFTLSAIDTSGRTWKSERIINPSPGGVVEGLGFVVSADCCQIELSERVPSEPGVWVRLRSFETCKFPCTIGTETVTTIGPDLTTRSGELNAAKVTSNGFTFLFQNRDGVDVNIWSDGLIPGSMFEERVTEAMTFALGTLPHWVLLSRTEGSQTVTKFRWTEPGKPLHPYPPQSFNMIDESGFVWKLFELYLSFVVDDNRCHVHDLSQSICGVVQSRGSSIQGQALAVAVAVEAVLGRFFKSVGAPSESCVQSVTELETYISSWPGDKVVIARALGAVGGLKATRAGDSLKKLQADGIVGKDEVSAWKSLRNSAAHGNWDYYDDELQTLIDLKNRVLCLLHQLVFSLIGYQGTQTNYGAPGWPPVDYPPRQIEQ